jgi:hypothetical protein
MAISLAVHPSAYGLEGSWSGRHSDIRRSSNLAGRLPGWDALQVMTIPRVE